MTTHWAATRDTPTTTLPRTTTAVGTWVQPKRQSRALTTPVPTTDARIAQMATFCTGRVSAFGPPCIRRASASGCLTARYMLGPMVATMKTAMKTQACQ